MKLRRNSATSTFTLILCSALLILAAPALAVDFVWDGNGDVNNGGVWSAPLNWDLDSGTPDDTGDTADFTAALSSVRFISNDVATTVGTMIAEDHANHRLWLDANLTVDTINGNHDKYKSYIYFNGQTLAVGEVLGPGNYTPILDGPGLFLKYGTGTATLQGAPDNFTGSMIVSNGTLRFRASTYQDTVLMTVLDGATAQLFSGGADFPTNVLINGNGFGGNGAIYYTTADSTAADFIVNTDSKMKTTVTATLTGDILGTGCLTLEGSTWILAGTGVTYTNTLKITNGSVQVTGDFPDLQNIIVDGGGTLEALQSQFPSGTIVTQNGGIWNQPTSASWTGNGDGSNWFDVANWAPNVVPTEQADLEQLLASPRYIRIDSNATVTTVLMEDDSDNRIIMDADWTVDTFGDEHNIFFSRVDLNGHTLTVGRSIATTAYMPELDGPGTFIKNTAGTCTLQTEDEFTGQMIVSNGTLQFRSEDWDTTTLLTVNGGTARQTGTGASMPTNIAINGNGYNNGGALQFSVTDSHSSVVTVNTDSKMKQTGGTTTLNGDIKGTGCLMLEGPGTWILAATGMTYTNKLIVTNGTLQLNGSFPDLINILVDQDGVLEAVPAQFPSASVVTQNGGIWNVPTSATWTGLGDGSNWTDTANWAPNIIPTDQADLTATLASDRYINVDSDATVDTIVIVDGGNQYARHHLVLSADLTVETIDGGHDKYKSHIHVNDANTLTVGETIGTGAYMPNLDGSGTVIKHTTGTVTLQGAPDSFTGSFIVTNGTLRFRASTYANTLLLTVLDGTTANLLSVGADFPTNIVINGTGFGGAGALSWSTTDSHTSDITVNTDSTIVRGSGTTTLSGEISGPGDLTLDAGTGVFDLDGTYNFAISGAAANNMIADDGTLNIGDATLDVGNETGASELEYVIIDYSGSGTVSGQFTATNDLDAGWTVEYAGTATYTDSVVLVKTASPPETVIKFQ